LHGLQKSTEGIDIKDTSFLDAHSYLQQNV
jgi:hypothetical protein